jgi:hypothetical protein
MRRVDDQHHGIFSGNPSHPEKPAATCKTVEGPIAAYHPNYNRISG